MGRALWSVVVLAFLLAACAPDAPTCTSPYIANGATCCLDRDNDTACDTAAAVGSPTLDCSLCPPSFVTQVEEKVVYKYVCPDGTVYDTQDACPKGPASNAHEFRVNEYQDTSAVFAFDARVACRGEHNAAEMHLITNQTPRRVLVLAQSEPNGTFAQIGTIDGNRTVIDDIYYYIGFCDGQDCAGVTDAQLPSDTASVVRMVLEYPDHSVTTRDRLLDPTGEGEYGKKKC